MARNKRSIPEESIMDETSSISPIISGIEDADYGDGSSTATTTIIVDGVEVKDNTVNIYELQFVGYAGDIKQYRSK